MRVVVILSVILQTSIYFSVRAQDPIQLAADMLPPSPTAGELAKYSFLPVGLSSGTPSVDIPVYVYSTKNLSVPVSFSYNSNGIKVDQVSSWVGMGWSLNAGGVVTRIIRDERDRPEPTIVPDNFHVTNPDALEYLELADPANYFDSEPDLFAFNFQGYTGKFIFDQNGAPMVMPHQNIKIEWTFNGGETEGAFVLTTPDGIKYTFASPEYTRSYSVGQGCGKTYNMGSQTSWFLTKIEHPLGDVVFLEYDGFGTYTYATSVSQTVTKNREVIGYCPNTSCAQFDWPLTCKNFVEITGGYLKRIHSENFGEVVFDATRDRLDLDDYKLNNIKIIAPTGELVRSHSLQYAFTPTNLTGPINDPEKTERRMFLTGLRQLDKLGKIDGTYEFEYEDMDGLPSRLSYSQDHWGYFNNAENIYFTPKPFPNVSDVNGNDLFPGIQSNRSPNGDVSSKGLLTTITYPTGGTTQLTFEPNTYRGLKTIHSPSQVVALSVTGVGPHAPVTESIIFSPPFTQVVNLYGHAHVSNDIGENDEIDPTHNIGFLEMRNVTTGDIQISEILRLNEPSLQIALELDASMSYEFKVTAHGKVVDAGLFFNYFSAPPQTIEANIETGGNRIAKMVLYDPLSNKSETKNFHYASLETINVSSGTEPTIPIYYSTTRIRTPCWPQGHFYECVYGNLHSNSISNLYPTGNIVNYKYVTVMLENGENGAEEHEFIVNPDLPGLMVWGEDNILDAPYTNSGWDNGLERVVKYFRKANGQYHLLKRVENSYFRDTRRSREIPGVVVRRKFSPTETGPATIFCDPSKPNTYFYRWRCITDHDHLTYLGGVPFVTSQAICVRGGAYNVYELISEGPCNNRQGETITVPSNLAHLDALRYNYVVHWHYLKSTTTAVYNEFSSEPVLTVTEFEYENPDHLMLSKEEQTNSDFKKTVKTYKYLADYNDIENFSVLKNQFNLKLPIRIEKIVGEKLVDGTIFQYNDYGKPIAMHRYESKTLQAPSVHDPNTIFSTDYHLKANFLYQNNNLVEFISNTTPKISYKWGYGNSRVIAKAVGADARDVFFTSFEENGVLGESRTGSKYWNSGIFTMPAEFIPNSESDLRMSYWFWENDKWNFSGEVAFESTINRGSRLDEIRVYPRGAQVTTVTYDKDHRLVSTISDPNGVTRFFEYDDFGRLKSTRNSDLEIESLFNYRYIQK